jgi:hypothetical protein
MKETITGIKTKKNIIIVGIEIIFKHIDLVNIQNLDIYCLKYLGNKNV